MKWLEAFLAWLATLLAPQAVSTEHAKAAACVAVASSSMVKEDAPPPPPPAPDGECCQECRGTGWITHADGHRTPCPCPDTCKCKQRQGATCPRCLGLGVLAVWTNDRQWVEPCKYCKQSPP